MGASAAPPTAELAAWHTFVTGLGTLSRFPYHPQQEYALESATDTVVVCGGSQSGKTQAGLGIVDRLVRREGPIYARLREPEGRKLKIWVAPNLHEKYKSNWEERLLHEVFAGIPHTYVETPHPVFTWQDPHGGGELAGKSQEQGFMGFESDVVDLVLFDEEPLDRRLYSSAQTRTTTTNGVIVLLYTPLNGITWTYGALYLPTAQPEHQVADRVWRRWPSVTLIAQGMSDNPTAVAGGGVARLLRDPSITEAERQTRLYGTYGFVEGLIFPEFADLRADAIWDERRVVEVA